MPAAITAGGAGNAPPTCSAQAEAAARWARQAGAGTAYVVSDGSSYSDGLAAQFTNAAKKLGLAVIGSGRVSSGNVGDVSDVARQIAASRPDAVFYGDAHGAGALRSVTALISLVQAFATAVAGELLLENPESLGTQEDILTAFDPYRH